MSAVWDDLNILLQAGVNAPVGPINLGIRGRTDGAISGEVGYGFYQGRGAYNPFTGEWSAALGVGRSFGAYDAWGGRAGVFAGAGFDQKGLFLQLTGTVAFPFGNDPNTPYFTGIRADYKYPLASYDELKKFIPPLLNDLRDPLVLDLDGDGIEVSSLTSSSIHFDYSGDGFAERTGWNYGDSALN